jgi:putative hemolysin
MRTTGDRLAYLRLRTYALEGTAHQSAYVPAARESVPVARPTIPPVPPEALRADIAALDPSRLLLRSGDRHVYCARAEELPNVLREIGRLREVTFRAAGEGTGHEIDLDRFDARYWHLFVWHDGRGEVAGAYRLGASEASRPWPGRGLYTRTLFRYGRRFLGELGSALELGRSFVRQEFQRDYGTLLLLWRGIGHFVARHPQYRMLFGPVSISAEYSAASRELLVAALSSPRFVSGLAALVRPKRALEVRQSRIGEPGTTLTADSLDALLREAEPDGKGLPVLLRQYLRLGGRLVSFSVDPAFGNVVDGLMVVDLADVTLPLLQRNMGRDGAASFLAFHRAASPSTDCEPVVASA